MSDYKELINTLVEDVAQGQLGAANKSFKTLMASKLVEGLNEHANSIQNQISEAYPEIFDGPVESEVAGEVPDIEEYPADSEDDGVIPEQGKANADAHYAGDEDQDVYEQVVVDGGSMDDDPFTDVTEEEEEEMEESAFHGAAAAAKEAGQTEFEFPEGSGKMHPVTMDDDTAGEINAG